MSEENTGRHMSAHIHEELAHRRVLMLDCALEEHNASWLMGKLLTFAADSPTQGIWLWINSPGGSVPAMLAIRDVIRAIPNPVSTLALGMAASAGQFLLSGGTPGRRFALPHAKVLLHQGSAGIAGSAADVELAAEELRDMRNTVLGIVAEDTGQPVDRVFADSLRDRWFTAEQAQQYGFIDHIVSSFADISPTGPRHTIGLTTAVEKAASSAEGDQW
ncbi:ATP-dependent Clp protease proteolytic subunit [Nesterenkonia salmonea]|uniref:ATP-dependent Clp protease proteolytic subunit n=1 Tax=Nesterenkonia salmonea TaxID=1804987 RepID=A0A5R9BBS9_9MICC|nr:ATP-dependent Clp protease proteolytic subunit [Nesterenkonia salmonea]TLP98114.1 ATP-dependent Clp protease proteolytic subunit [Nesterenkonia salmonea]